MVEILTELSEGGSFRNTAKHDHFCHSNMFSQGGLYLLKNNPVSSAWLFICYLNQNSCLQLMKMAEILLQLKWIFPFAPARHVSKPGWNLAVFIYKKRLWLWIWPWMNLDVSRCKTLLVITKIWNSLSCTIAKFEIILIGEKACVFQSHINVQERHQRMDKSPSGEILSKALHACPYSGEWRPGQGAHSAAQDHLCHLRFSCTGVCGIDTRQCESFSSQMRSKGKRGRRLWMCLKGKEFLPIYYY